MALMRFVADRTERLTDARLARAYVAGMDEVATPGRVLKTDEGTLTVERDDDSSGCFALPWPVAGQGDWLIATSTLMQRDKPYQLEVELARGLVFRVRDQLSVWQHLGLQTPDEIHQAAQSMTAAFARAATQQHTPSEAARLAEVAISEAAELAIEIANLYASQAIAIRMQGGERLGTLIGVRSGATPPPADAKIDQAFNLLTIPCGWGAVEPGEGQRDWSATDAPLEWATSAGMRTCCGPLLEFDDRKLPDWAYLWEGEFETLANLMLAHIRATVERYRGRVQLWNAASRINREGILSLNYEQRLRIVAGAVETIRELDPKTPIVVGIDQPWGEYRARRGEELTPLDYADALERADLGIAGFNLEMNIGYQPNSTALRNPLAFSRLIDMWNMRLEAPLMLTLTIPSAATGSDLADSKVSVVAAEEQPELLTPDWQAEWAQRRIPMLLAKNAVQVIQWGQLSDAEPHTWPCGGLIDHEQQTKPLLQVFSDLRARYLS